MKHQRIKFRCNPDGTKGQPAAISLWNTNMLCYDHILVLVYIQLWKCILKLCCIWLYNFRIFSWSWNCFFLGVPITPGPLLFVFWLDLGFHSLLCWEWETLWCPITCWCGLLLCWLFKDGLLTATPGNEGSVTAVWLRCSVLWTVPADWNESEDVPSFPTTELLAWELLGGNNYFPLWSEDCLRTPTTPTSRLIAPDDLESGETKAKIWWANMSNKACYAWGRNKAIYLEMKQPKDNTTKRGNWMKNQGKRLD